jgi:hypothetical protein
MFSLALWGFPAYCFTFINPERGGMLLPPPHTDASLVLCFPLPHYSIKASTSMVLYTSTLQQMHLCFLVFHQHLHPPTNASLVIHLLLHPPRCISGIPPTPPPTKMHLWDSTYTSTLQDASLVFHLHLHPPRCISGILPTILPILSLVVHLYGPSNRCFSGISPTPPPSKMHLCYSTYISTLPKMHLW